MIFDGQREVRGTGTGKKRNQVSVYGEQYREKGVLHRNTWRDCSCQELSRVSIFFFFLQNKTVPIILIMWEHILMQEGGEVGSETETTLPPQLHCLP